MNFLKHLADLFKIYFWSLLKTSKIVLVFTKNPRKLHYNNYHLTFTLKDNKILEKLKYTRLYNFFTKSNLINDLKKRAPCKQFLHPMFWLI